MWTKNKVSRVFVYSSAGIKNKDFTPFLGMILKWSENANDNRILGVGSKGLDGGYVTAMSAGPIITLTI